jgi:hypothetical protein
MCATLLMKRAIADKHERRYGADHFADAAADIGRWHLSDIDRHERKAQIADLSRLFQVSIEIPPR